MLLASLFGGAAGAAAVTAVRALAGAAAGQQPYAVAFSEFYAETTGVIYLPNLALATEQTVPEPSCRFSPPDWEHQDYEWSETAGDWGDRLVEAVSGTATTVQSEPQARAAYPAPVFSAFRCTTASRHLFLWR